MFKQRIRFSGCSGELSIPDKCNGSVAIICPELPNNPGLDTVTDLMYQEGYIILHPQYEGSWDSCGEFSPENCINTISYTIKYLKGENEIDNINNLFHKKHLKDIILVGSSFGAAVALAVASKYKFIKNICLISPMIYIKDQTLKPFPLEESFQNSISTIKNKFGKEYREKSINEWKDMLSGNGSLALDKLILQESLKNIFFLHGTKDPKISYLRTKEFIDKLNQAFPQLIISKRFPDNSEHGWKLVPYAIAKLKFWLRSLQGTVESLDSSLCREETNTEGLAKV